MNRAAERKQKMFFAHLQHLCLLDMPSVGCTVSAPSPCTPPCIHSNTHTCTKYVSCCILATGKVITERAKELACCRAADLIPALEKQEGRDFPLCCPTQHFYIHAVKCEFCFSLVYCSRPDKPNQTSFSSRSKICVCSQVASLWTKRKDESVV